MLVVGFESADHPLDAWMTRAPRMLPRPRRHRSRKAPAGPGATTSTSREGAAGAWRQAFLDMPYLRDALVAMGMISETFETAVTWDRFAEFHAGVIAATTDAVRRVCGAGTVTCRFTHVYADGVAPYYTVLAPARPGAQLAQWAEIKTAAAETLLALGGHDHAPPRRRTRPPSLVRPRAPRRLRTRPRGREEHARSPRSAQSRRPDLEVGGRSDRHRRSVASLSPYNLTFKDVN